MTFEEASKFLKSGNKKSVNDSKINIYDGLCVNCAHSEDGCMFREPDVISCSFYAITNK